LTAISYEFYAPFPNPAPSEINDAVGYVAIVAHSYIGDPNGFSTIDLVPMARINFVVDDIGTSPLDLHDSVLSDIYGAWIAHDVLDGFFANINAKVPDVTPTSATPPQSTNNSSSQTIQLQQSSNQSTESDDFRSIPYVAQHNFDALEASQSSSTLQYYYAGIDLVDTYSFNGISGRIQIYQNRIDSTSTSDMVASSIGVAQYNPLYNDYEYIEVGSRQDSRGLFCTVLIILLWDVGLKPHTRILSTLGRHTC